jgi:hypothetical protein
MRLLIAPLFALLLTAGLALSALAPDGADESEGRPATPAYSLSEIWAIFARGDRIEQQRQRQFAFWAQVEEVLSTLMSGRLSLSDAAEQVEAIAHSINPEFLETLQLNHPGTSDRQRIAHNLMCHLQVRRQNGQPTAQTEAVIESLQCELDAWLSARFASPVRDLSAPQP